MLLSPEADVPMHQTSSLERGCTFWRCFHVRIFSNRGERTIIQSDSRSIPLIHQPAEFVEIIGIAVCFNQERKMYKGQAVAADGVVAHEPEVQPPKEHR